MTGHFVERLIRTACEKPQLHCQGIETATAIEAQENLQTGEPAFESKPHTNPKAMRLAFQRQLRNKFGGSRQELLKAQEISSNRFQKFKGRIASLCFNLSKHCIVFSKALLDFLKFEMMARKEIAYREWLVYYSAFSATP